LILPIFYEHFLLAPSFFPENGEIFATPPISLTIDDWRLPFDRLMALGFIDGLIADLNIQFLEKCQPFFIVD